MKYSLPILFLLSCLYSTAQKNTKANLYPIPTAFYTKSPVFDECVEGNCENGTGIRLKLEKWGAEDRPYTGYYLYFTLQKGEFSDGGKAFNGKLYRPRLWFNQKDKKQLVPAQAYDFRTNTTEKPFDFTNDSLLKPFFVGEGQRRNNKWHGNAKTTAFLEMFPRLTVHQLAYTDDVLVWMDVEFPADHPFSRFTGRTFSSGDFISGKAVLKNGDIYEGFLFGPNFVGPGRLTKKDGKIKQGIWQLDSLLVEVPLEFSAAVLDPVLPPNAAPTSGNYPVVHGIKQLNPEFYGPMQNNEANGWGLMKMQVYYHNSHHTMRGYGKWANNQLDGPGIMIDLADGTIAYTAGIFNKGVLQHGLKWNTNLSTSWVYSNEQLSRMTQLGEQLSKMGVTQPNRIWMYAGHFVNDTLSGCGIMNNEIHVGQFFNSKIHITYPIEGNFEKGSIRGFYFDGDTGRKRTYEYLRYTFKVTEEKIKMAEAETNFCFDIMKRYQPLYVAEMKKRLASDIAEEDWRKSPEGLAHKLRVEQENKKYAAEKQKECDAKFAKVGTRGRTYMYRGVPVILSGYDCATDEFIAWRPWQSGDSYDNMAIQQVRGYSPLFKLEHSAKQYQTCADCDGTGKMIVTTTTTRTKELPWGYFSGIETKSIRTTTKEEMKSCNKCNGLAIVLK